MSHFSLYIFCDKIKIYATIIQFYTKYCIWLLLKKCTGMIWSNMFGQIHIVSVKHINKCILNVYLFNYKYKELLILPNAECANPRCSVNLHLSDMESAVSHFLLKNHIGLLLQIQNKRCKGSWKWLSRYNDLSNIQKTSSP